MDPAALLGDLDERQKAAVTTPSALVAVIAAAGSGKTRVLTRRIVHRVATGTADARHTLALTFTREAAGELRRRLRASGLREPVEAGTFHSVAFGVLRQRWTDSGRPAPNVVSDRNRLLAEVADGCPLDVIAAERTWAAARGVSASDYVATARSSNRRSGIPSERVGSVLEAYDALKRRRGVVDFDDLLLMLSRELETDHSFADATRWRFRHVLVDEAQDLNPVQYRLLRQVIAGRNDLFLVGDPAQAIYAFNGSDPALLIDIDRHLPGIEVVRLETNRRSTPQIVAAGRHVLRVSGQSADAESSRADGPPVEIIVGADEADEASRIARFARSLPPTLVNSGAVAVVARTHDQLGGLRAALTDARVPTRHDALAPGSVLAGVVRTATLMRSSSQLRAWAHDTLDVRPAAAGVHGVGDHEQAERRVAGAILDFLREQPQADGFALRAWLLTTKPFADPGDREGVELLTFHAAKGREWHTVVVSGVETGLVPHRSATTIDAKAEEARLLHVAITRATDRLVISRAQRRRGYARHASPLLVDLAVPAAVAVAPPATLQRPPDPRGRRTASLGVWRERAARATAMLPAQICSDDDLVAIAASPPTSAAELSALTGFGPIAAARLFAPIRAAIDAADDAGT